jgi:hypothetical protein
VASKKLRKRKDDRMNRFKLLCCALCLSASGAAAADALTTLNDAEGFKKAQKDVAAMPRAELDALLDTVATCSSVSIGQRMQQFECERGLNVYWARYSRGRALDNYLSAVGGLFTAFDNNALNPTQEMTQGYRRASNDLVTLMHTINERYRQLEK